MHQASIEDQRMLKSFLLSSVRRDDKGVNVISPRADVTIIMYFFWESHLAAEKWPFFKGALLETWRHCGLLKTVVVSNDRHHCLEEFVRSFANVTLHVEKSLIPGNINTMSIDCNARLYTRFDTRYVLIVQDDGFPLRAGLDEFIEKGYDFIGSPYCRALCIPDLLTRVLNYCPSNGGFSLRTRRMCEMAARLWWQSYSSRSFIVDEMSEDLFYTKTLPRAGFGYWFNRNQAPSIVSERFSYEGTFPLYSRVMPLGFHTATGFATLVRRFKDMFPLIVV